MRKYAKIVNIIIISNYCLFAYLVTHNVIFWRILNNNFLPTKFFLINYSQLKLFLFFKVHRVNIKKTFILFSPQKLSQAVWETIIFYIFQSNKALE